MKYAALILLIAVAACTAIPQGDYCDITRLLTFDSADTINWLADNDRPLLAGIVAHNETAARCP
jgi:hypothetical protein